MMWLPHYATVAAIAWCSIVLVGAAIQSYLLRESLLDLRALNQASKLRFGTPDRAGPAHDLALAHVVQSSTHLGIKISALLIGVASMYARPPTIIKDPDSWFRSLATVVVLLIMVALVGLGLNGLRLRRKLLGRRV